MSEIVRFNAKRFVSEIVRDPVAPILADVGFRKSGNMFRRKSEEWWDVISMQMNRWGSAESSSVGMHIGVWWRRIEELASPENVGRPPKEWACTVRVFVGRKTGRRQTDWPVDPSTDREELAREMARAVHRRALPWIESAHVMKNLLNLKQANSLVYKSEVATHYLLGQKRKVIERLRDGYNVYLDDPELHADFVPFATRLGYGKADLQKLRLDRRETDRREELG